MNVMCGWVWCEDVDTYHGRGRLRPEGVRVIAHVHYACESYMCSNDTPYEVFFRMKHVPYETKELHMSVYEAE